MRSWYIKIYAEYNLDTSIDFICFGLKYFIPIFVSDTSQQGEFFMYFHNQNNSVVWLRRA